MKQIVLTITDADFLFPETEFGELAPMDPKYDPTILRLAQEQVDETITDFVILERLKSYDAEVMESEDGDLQMVAIMEVRSPSCVSEKVQVVCHY